MRKSLIVAAAVTAVVIGTASPALAATPATSAPAAPAAVHVTARSATSAALTWAAARPARPAATGYSVAISPTAGVLNHGLGSLRATVHGVVVSGLHAGTTYTFTVRAASGSKKSAPKSVRWTAPKPSVPTPPTKPAESLFALDASGALVRFPTSGGAATTVAASGAGYAVDGAGNAYVPSGDAIVEYPAAGGSKTVATGLALDGDLHADASGDLFWTDSSTGTVDELAAGTTTATTAIDAPAAYLAVGNDGSVFAVDRSAQGITVVTRSAAGATTTRDIADSGYVYPVEAIADGKGTLYLALQSTGASGNVSWSALPAGSSTATNIDARQGYDYGAANANGFSLLQSSGWCWYVAEAQGRCTPDRSVPDLQTWSVTGGKQSVAVSGLSTGGPNSRGPWVGAADAAGDVFVAVADGPTAGLYEVPAAGGAAKAISTQQFSRLQVG